jgi:hypothetical protein
MKQQCEVAVESGADADRYVPARAAEVLDRIRQGGAPVERVVVTENRRIMISVSGADRRTLRLHRNFLDAPEDVLEAIAAFLSARRAERPRARARIREFLMQRPVAPPVRRPRRINAADQPYLQKLRAEFDRVNTEHFAGELPTVPIHLSGRIRQRNGHFCSNPLEIVISRQLCTRAVDGEAEHTLRHEMIHLWQHHTGNPVGHGRQFRDWARRLAVHPRASRSVCWR